MSVCRRRQIQLARYADAVWEAVLCLRSLGVVCDGGKVVEAHGRIAKKLSTVYKRQLVRVCLDDLLVRAVCRANVVKRGRLLVGERDVSRRDFGRADAYAPPLFKERRGRDDQPSGTALAATADDR